MIPHQLITLFSAGGRGISIDPARV